MAFGPPKGRGGGGGGGVKEYLELLHKLKEENHRNRMRLEELYVNGVKMGMSRASSADREETKPRKLCHRNEEVARTGRKERRDDNSTKSTAVSNSRQSGNDVQEEKENLKNLWRKLLENHDEGDGVEKWESEKRECEVDKHDKNNKEKQFKFEPNVFHAWTEHQSNGASTSDGVECHVDDVWTREYGIEDELESPLMTISGRMRNKMVVNVVRNGSKMMVGKGSIQEKKNLSTTRRELHTEMRSKRAHSACREAVRKVEEEKVEKRLKDEEEMKKVFRARPVPASSVLQLYGEMVEKQRRHQDERKKVRIKQLISEQKPFSFCSTNTSGSVETTGGGGDSEKKKEKKQKATRTRSASSATDVHQYKFRAEIEAEYREIKRRAREKALRDVSKYPAKMEKMRRDEAKPATDDKVGGQVSRTTTSANGEPQYHRKSCSNRHAYRSPTFHPHVHRSVPDFQKLWHTKEMENVERGVTRRRIGTICRPFALSTQRRGEDRLHGKLERSKSEPQLKMNKQALKASVERLSRPVNRDNKEIKGKNSKPKDEWRRLAVSIREQSQFNLSLVRCGKGADEVIARRTRKMRREMRSRSKEYESEVKEIERRVRRSRPLLMQGVGLNVNTLERLAKEMLTTYSDEVEDKEEDEKEREGEENGEESDEDENEGESEEVENEGESEEDESDEDEHISISSSRTSRGVEKHSPDSGAIPSPISSLDEGGCREIEVGSRMRIRGRDKDEGDSGRQSANDKDGDLVPSFSDIE